jgi:ketopantoate reductase
LKGKALEIEAVFGSVLELAQRHQITTPHLDRAFALLKGLDRHLELRR